jgi:phosphopantetheinyl transferase (holo-ACP synthase)
MDEISGCQPDARPAEHFAGKFAAKEALMKAMDTGRGKGDHRRGPQGLRA